MLMEEISTLLADLLLKVRDGEGLDEGLLGDLESRLDEVDDPALREHLESVIKGLRERSYEERSILGKSIRLGREELETVLESIDGFLEEEPFSEMDSGKIMILWRDVLKELADKLPEFDRSFPNRSP